MPARMIHYLIAEKVADRIKINDMNRFRLGSICPDMSTRADNSKHLTHYMENFGEVKGVNLMTYLSKYGDRMDKDDLYLGILCHLITDMIWFHDIMNPCIRTKVKDRQERQIMYQKGYSDFHRLNYILKKEFGLKYELTEDRNIELEGLHPELYEEVTEGLYKDFVEDPEAQKEDLEIYKYDLALDCILLSVEECISAITALREGKEIPSLEKYYVPVLE